VTRLRKRELRRKQTQPAFQKIGINGVGWHTFRHTVGTMLADMGEHQLTIRDYLRTCQPSRHEQIPAGDVEDEASCARQIGRCDPGCGVLAETEPGAIGGAYCEVRAGNSRLPLIVTSYSLDPSGAGLVSDWKISRGRRDSNSRPLP